MITDYLKLCGCVCMCYVRGCVCHFPFIIFKLNLERVTYIVFFINILLTANLRCVWKHALVIALFLKHVSKKSKFYFIFIYVI